MNYYNIQPINFFMQNIQPINYDIV